MRKYINTICMLILIPWLLSACVPKQNQLDIKTYLFSVPYTSDTTVESHQGDQHNLPTIEISSFSADAPFDSKFFIFRLSLGHYQKDYYHRFLASPVTQLEQIMIKSLKQSGYFRHVLGKDSMEKSDYKVDFVLTQLYVDAIDKQHMHAVISIAVRVAREKFNGDATLMFNQTYTEKIPITNYHSNAQSIILAWSQGLAIILDRLRTMEATLASGQMPLNAN